MEASEDAVAIREPASAALIAHIQSTTENHKALLARELHDDLGGLLVGAIMDVAWAEQHLSAPASELKQKLLRARQALASAIDLKRRVIEDLRPTLLDNVGLFAALRWHVQTTSNANATVCTLSIPEEERRFLPNVSIALFRIVQEAFAVIFAQGPCSSAHFSLVATDQSLTICFAGRRIATDDALNSDEPQALSAVRCRTSILGGIFTCSNLNAEGPVMTATFPCERMFAVI